MTERDEMIERAKARVVELKIDDRTIVAWPVVMSNFAASEVARERERIADELERLLRGLFLGDAGSSMYGYIDRLRSKD